MDNRLVTERVQYTVIEMKLEQTAFSDFWKKRLGKCQGVSFVADLTLWPWSWTFKF
jgi:hypothetical protein